MEKEQTYQGSCHCGAVSFTAKMNLTNITQCNCSICHKKGALHHRILMDKFTLLSGEKDLTLYQFGSKEAKHLFCRHCGIHAFSHPRFDPTMISINIRSLDDFDSDTADYQLRLFDGKNWEQAAKEIRNKP